jgi:hypothetical protein
VNFYPVKIEFEIIIKIKINKLLKFLRMIRRIFIKTLIICNKYNKFHIRVALIP